MAAGAFDADQLDVLSRKSVDKDSGSAVQMAESYSIMNPTIKQMIMPDEILRAAHCLRRDVDNACIRILQLKSRDSNYDHMA